MLGDNCCLSDWIFTTRDFGSQLRHLQITDITLSISTGHSWASSPQFLKYKIRISESDKIHTEEFSFSIIGAVSQGLGIKSKRLNDGHRLQSKKAIVRIVNISSYHTASASQMFGHISTLFFITKNCFRITLDVNTLY